jgi:hypothetical protein
MASTVSPALATSSSKNERHPRLSLSIFDRNGCSNKIFDGFGVFTTASVELQIESKMEDAQRDNAPQLVEVTFNNAGYFHDP